METKILNKIFIGIFLLVLTLGLISSVVVDANYVTLYSGEQGVVNINIENNENFDIEDVSIVLNLDDVPFTSVGSSEKDVDDLDEDDDDRVSFTLRPSTDITPGDYNIPYTLTYFNADNNNDSEVLGKEGSFGIRVSAKTELDFSIEIREIAIVGQEGRFSLEVINKGLGEVKSVSVQIFPNGFELLSKDKVFIGSIDADDTDIASFDVIYKIKTPSLSARVEYKDFDNIGQTETINIPFKAYTTEEAIELGLIQKSNTRTYLITGIVILIIWFVWRKIKKKRKEKNRRVE